MLYRVLMSILASALAIVLATAAQAQGTYEPDTNRPGGDFTHFAVGPNPLDCQAACARDNRCVAWTYGQKAQRCWLKGAPMRPKREFGAVSGVVRNAAARPAPGPGPMAGMPAPLAGIPGFGPGPGYQNNPYGRPPAPAPAPAAASAPGLTASCMKLFDRYQKGAGYRAFAASGDGKRCGYSSGKYTMKDAVDVAMQYCNRVTGTGCTLRASSK